MARDAKSVNKNRNSVNGGQEAESTGLGDLLRVKNNPQVFDLGKWTF